MLDAVRSHDGQWDIIVIGGGATGAGCALDAASRGLKVLLLEQSDFGKGTSSRSTKLVHGGVRYLEQGNISLVKEALRERGLLLQNAPNHVFKQEFVIPCYSNWEKFYYSTGLRIYDILARKLKLGKTRTLTRTETLEKLPNISDENLVGGVLYFDGRFDDTKLLIELMKASERIGATVLNYAPVTGFLRDNAGTISGVEFKCAESGEVFIVKAKAVINAAGVFSESIRTLSNKKSVPVLTYSQGTHLVFDSNVFDNQTALMIPKTSDGRVLFAIPFYGKTLVGTTETPIGIPVLEPHAKEIEIQFILDTCTNHFKKEVRRDDIRSVFAGIRPLVADRTSTTTASISRGHIVDVDSHGLVTITGGKWTTFRKMAEDAVNKAMVQAGIKPSETQTVELDIETPQEFDETGLEEPISEQFEWTAADVVKSVRFEMARTVEDVLARRTRILFLDAREAARVAPFVAELIASELGYKSDWIEQQILLFNKTASGYLA